MRCPKCQYISFDDGDKCRNCGYEFSLSINPATLDLPMQTGDEAVGPFSDLDLSDIDAPVTRETTPELPPMAAPRPITSSFDLPLFRDRTTDSDAPLVSAPAVPRAPLAVRKGTPVVTRPAARRGLPQDLQLDLEPGDAGAHGTQAATHTLPQATAPAVAEGTAAPVGARLLAGVVDSLLLATIDVGVLHFTLKLCGLTYAEIGVLPLAPFAAFLLLLNGGYLTAFTTAGGQSIGKMLAGIRVVTSDPEAWTDRVPIGQAVLRAVACVVSALPLGLGFLPAMIGPERRAIHDRLAHTRVVKA